MSSRCPDGRRPASPGAARRARPLMAGPVAAALLLLPGLPGCDREERRFNELPPGAAASPLVVQNDRVQPGTFLVDPEVRSAYEVNAWALSEGEKLYNAFNCSGCHSPRGGGGMGPPLADSLWIYGHEPENIFQSIVQGRPNGMPAFRGRIGNPEVWKLVAYVRSMSGLTPMSTRSARTEGMRGATPAPQTTTKAPMSQRIPPEQRPPEPPSLPPPAGGRS